MVLNEVEVMWACVHEVNEMSGKYQVDAVNLTKEQVKTLESTGVEVQTCDREEGNRGSFITLKSTRPVKVVDKEKTPITELVGNGSVCNVAWNPFEWAFKKKSGISAGLQALQVIKLVSYSSGGVDEFDFDAPDNEIPF